MNAIKTAFWATVSVTALSSATYAGSNNNAYLDQNGAGNSALVTQFGDNNNAGSPTHAMQQTGDNNDLDVLQSGGGNYIGVKKNGHQNEVDQIGDANVASISQTSDDNIVNSIQQNALTAAGTNVLTITQGSSSAAYATNGGSDPMRGYGSILSGVAQTNTGGANNSVTVSQDSNAASSGYYRNRIGGNAGRGGPGIIFRGSNLQMTSNGIRQNGAGNDANLSQTGGGHLIVLTDQTGAGNTIDIDQLGGTSGGKQGNDVVGVIQDSSGYGLGNFAKIYQDGERNGQSGFSTGSFAEGAGVARSTVTQYGGDNDVDYMATGNDNEFGFYQNGTGNSVGMVTILGNGNETAGHQVGTDNLITIAPIVGNDNDVGVRQNGTMNDADIALTNGSDRNAIGIQQNGTNSADVDVDGDDNFANITQFGTNSGLGAGVVLNITGNFNGTGAFSGDAGTVGLVSGTIFQDGSNNLFTSTIIGDLNDFSGKQLGDDNTIIASVSGSSNQYAISQVGNGNLANLSQIGNGNNAGILQ